MRHKLQIKLLLIPLLVGLITSQKGLPFVPEPDTAVYGTITHRFTQPLLPQSNNEVFVVASLNGKAIAVTPIQKATNYFLLRIPMSAGNPRIQNTAIPKDTIKIFISNALDGIIYDCGAIQIPEERGPVIVFNPVLSANVTGTPTDSNNDGIPDYWATYYGYNITEVIASKDDDGDGINNYAEYAFGTDPKNPNDKFKVVATLGNEKTGKLLIHFHPTYSYKTYVILQSDSPFGPWVEYTRITPSENGSTILEILVNTSNQTKFFRIGVSDQTTSSK